MRQPISHNELKPVSSSRYLKWRRAGPRRAGQGRAGQGRAGRQRATILHNRHSPRLPSRVFLLFFALKKEEKEEEEKEGEVIFLLFDFGFRLSFCGRGPPGQQRAVCRCASRLRQAGGGGV